MQNNQILSISNASLQDGGVYQCHVSQGSMKLNRNISLTIRGECMIKESDTGYHVMTLLVISVIMSNFICI